MNDFPNFKYELEKKPRLGPDGITRGVSVKEFKASENLAGVSMHLDPGAFRVTCMKRSI
jgi:oxalate decarboxylase